MSSLPLRIRVAATILLLVLAGWARAEEPVIVAGNARFTVISPNLIRIEHSKDGKFIDDRSLFAVDRNAHFTEFKRTQDGPAIVIDTGIIKLSYIPDNQELSPQNLKAVIGDKQIEWRPGKKNEHNLGGTIRTLDGVSGPVNLGEGVLSRDGWYLLDDSKTPLFTQDWVRSRPADAGSDWYLFGYGNDYHAALKALTTIGGPIPMPRKYALGAWYSRYWNYTADDFKQIVEEYKQHDFPLDVIVMDMDWHVTNVPGAKRGYAGQIWTGYTWDKKLIPDPEGLLKWFHEQGLHVTLNDHPADGVQVHESVYEQFMRDMGKDASTKEQLPFDAGDKKYLDTFWKDTHAPLNAMGVDFWWLDWQQYPFTRSIADLTNLWWLNHYYYERSKDTGQRGISFSRWAGWGDHRHPIHFSGDANTNWPTLAFEVPFTSTAGNVGCFFWSHDIGGHMGGRNEESYARWCQFGALTAALRSHSTRDKTMDRRPWTYPKWAEDSMKVSFHLRSELFPYIYSSAWQATHESVPLNRPMYIDYPKEEQAYQNPQQYLFGRDLLVAPIASPGVGPGRVSRQVVWFPEGWWFNYFTSERFVGGSSFDPQLVGASMNEFPLYFRGGVPVLMQPYTQRMATTPLETLVVRCYPGEDGKTGKTTLYEDDGVSGAYSRGEFATTDVSYSRHGSEITIVISPTKGTFKGQPRQRAYQIILPGLKNLFANMPGARADYDEHSHTATITVEKQPIDSEFRVGVSGELIGFDQFGSDSAKQRAQGLEDQPEALLWTRGVGLIRSNDGTCGYGGQEQVHFYAPRGVIDGDHFKWSFDQQNGEADVTGKPFVLQSSVDPKLIAFHRKAHVSLSFNGKPVTLDVTIPFEGALMSDRNVARKAKATASSTEQDYRPRGVIDGKPSGYPADKRAEWASNHEKDGAWVRLEWETPQTIDTIAVFDRPNTSDQVTAGEIAFSDGSTVGVGSLPDDASEPVELHFAPKTITWMQFKITGIKPGTQNAGVSEIAAFSPAP